LLALRPAEERATSEFAAPGCDIYKTHTHTPPDTTICLLLLAPYDYSTWLAQLDGIFWRITSAPSNLSARLAQLDRVLGGRQHHITLAPGDLGTRLAKFDRVLWRVTSTPDNLGSWFAQLDIIRRITFAPGDLGARLTQLDRVERLANGESLSLVAHEMLIEKKATMELQELWSRTSASATGVGSALPSAIKPMVQRSVDFMLTVAH
jgi:hypothetical protein